MGHNIAVSMFCGMGLFLRSESPGLVFSATYLRGILTPSAFSAYGVAAASPGDKSRKDGGLPPVTPEEPHAAHLRRLLCNLFSAPFNKVLRVKRLLGRPTNTV